MDGRHRLDAPNNDILRGIEQVGDHSQLSATYPQSKAQWTGELVTKDERETRRQHAQDTISFGIRKEFITVGFLVPMPFILAGLMATAAFTFITEDNVPMYVTPGIIVFLVWAVITYFTYKKLNTLFYMNALQAAPYAVILNLLLVMLAFMTFHIMPTFYVLPILATAGVLSIATLLYSTVLSFFLLRLWTTPLLSSNAKLLIITASGITLLATGVFFSLF